MESISVILLIKKDCLSWYYSLIEAGLRIDNEQSVIHGKPDKSIIKLNDVPIELVIGLHGEDAEIYKLFFQKFTDKVFIIDKEKNTAEAYNFLFRRADKQFICIFRPNLLFQHNWLLDLYFYAKNVDLVGLLSIASDPANCEFTSVMDSEQEQMVGVFSPKNDSISQNGVVLFNKNLFYLVGGLDISPEFNGFELLQFELRASFLGFFNFYIPNQCCTAYLYEDAFTPTRMDFVKQKVLEMAKDKRLYIPLPMA